MKNIVKTVALGLLTVGMLAGCDNSSSGGSSAKKWDKAMEQAMKDEFGVVIPAFDYTDDDLVELEDGEFFAWIGFESEAKTDKFIKSYDKALKKAGFEGSYEFFEDDEEGDYYVGYYEHVTDKKETFFEEEFKLPLGLSLNAYEMYGEWGVILDAYLDVEYKDVAQFPTEKVVNVIGSAVSVYYIPEVTSYSYRYRIDSYGYIYFDLIAQGDKISEQSVLGHLNGSHYYIQEGGFLSSYDYWCLPWEENYELTISSIDDGYVALSYGAYAAATIYAAFPAIEVAAGIGLPEASKSELVAFASEESYGYKVWSSEYDEHFTNVDAIDPAVKDSSLKQLSVSYKEALLAASFAEIEGHEGFYSKTVGEKQLVIGFAEENFYFTAYFAYGDIEEIFAQEY